MRLKIAITTLLMLVTVVAMEKAPRARMDINKMLIESERPASLKLTIAWKVATGKIALKSIQAIPLEILDLVKQIKSILACRSCSIQEKKLFVNLLNNPDLDIKVHFPNILKQYNLVEGEADRKKIFNGLLLKAAKDKKLDLLKLAIDLGADINVTDSEGDSALICATRLNNNMKALELLLSSGADPDIQNISKNTALILAVLGDDKEAARKLLRAKANPNIQNYEGNTALIVAVKLNNRALVKMLLDFKADVSIENKYKNTALDFAEKLPEKEIKNMIAQK